jgi:hypothetical protein
MKIVGCMKTAELRRLGKLLYNRQAAALHKETWKTARMISTIYKKNENCE